MKNWFDMKLALQSDLHYGIRVICMCYLFMLVIGVVQIDLGQVMDLGSDAVYVFVHVEVLLDVERG